MLFLTQQNSYYMCRYSCKDLSRPQWNKHTLKHLYTQAGSIVGNSVMHLHHFVAGIHQFYQPIMKTCFWLPVLKVLHFIANNKALIFSIVGHQWHHLAVSLWPLGRRVHCPNSLNSQCALLQCFLPARRCSVSVILKPARWAPVLVLSKMLKYKTGLPGFHAGDLRNVSGLFCHVFTLAGLLHLADTMRKLIWDN